jgi:hypothetical protein
MIQEDTEILKRFAELQADRDKYKKLCEEYALLLFQPQGETHHDANVCPYCQENLNGKS